MTVSAFTASILVLFGFDILTCFLSGVFLDPESSAENSGKFFWKFLSSSEALLAISELNVLYFAAFKLGGALLKAAIVSSVDFAFAKARAAASDFLEFSSIFFVSLGAFEVKSGFLTEAVLVASICFVLVDFAGIGSGEFDDFFTSAWLSLSFVTVSFVTVSVLDVAGSLLLRACNKPVTEFPLRVEEGELTLLSDCLD